MIRLIRFVIALWVLGILTSSIGGVIAQQDAETCQTWKEKALEVSSGYNAILRENMESINTPDTLARLSVLRYTLDQTDRSDEVEDAYQALRNTLILRADAIITELSENVEFSLTTSEILKEVDSQQTDFLTLINSLCGDSDTLLVADFSNCSNINSVERAMGAAYNTPDKLTEQYISDNRGETGCIAELVYDIEGWSAFWIKLPSLDLTGYSNVSFDIRGVTIPNNMQMKVELKRTSANELNNIYVAIEDDWQHVILKFEDFTSPGYADPISAYTDIDELVFVFEKGTSGASGIVEIDNIVFGN